jgi:hypothetical protein
MLSREGEMAKSKMPAALVARFKKKSTATKAKTAKASPSTMKAAKKSTKAK